MIPLLVKTLERVHNKDLLLLVVSFLKKLAIFIENVLDMVRALNPLFFQGEYHSLRSPFLATVPPQEKTPLVTLLLKLLPNESADLQGLVLRLMLNLSFNKKLRGKMVKAGYINKLCNLLKSARSCAVTPVRIVQLIRHSRIWQYTRRIFVQIYSY